MSKRRSVIKRIASGLIGGSMMGVSGCEVKTNLKATDVDDTQLEKDWQNDPEWLKVRYGDWGGPGVSSQTGPMDNILLKDYAPRSSVVTHKSFLPKSKFLAIDGHVHVEARTKAELDEWVATMDEVGIERSLVLTSTVGKKFDDLYEFFVKDYSDRFIVCCGIDCSNIDQPDFSKRAVAELERCYNKGARGVGEISDKGYGITGDARMIPEKRLHPDDSRLDEFWEKCGELNMPISLHVADHPSCWTPLDVYQERSPDYQHFNRYGQDVRSHGELIEKRNRALEKHPNTIFVACHLGNQGHDLESLDRDMNKYPNLYLDTSARDYELGRTPRVSSRFLQKYKDRIMFGTDQGREKSMYRMHWQLLESADEYIIGRVGWRYYGLELPDAALTAIYRDTASRIYAI